MSNEPLYVTNADGEIIDVIDPEDTYTKLSTGDRVLRNGTIKYLYDAVNIKYHFVKINPLAYEKIAIKYPIINTLLKFVGYMDGKLTYRNGRPIKLKNLPEICGVSKSTVTRQIKGLMEEDVIHKVKDKKENQTYLIMNPYVAYIGKKVYSSLYEEFKLSEHRNNCEEVRG